ncbi:MAG: N-acetyltransferase [Proteobacteria bacterium]|uniref:N-acetyltransferase n=1 Tax=Candidatus Enterousia excrementavium TaxID=2840789 RepID=A0A940DD44_9PROT|nr:N-acetyltransferase [Candidatus Enterousia excrementavium]
MADEKITYDIFPNGAGFYANCNGHHVGEITFVRVGADKMIIDYTAVAEKYRGATVGLNLVRCAADLARQQRRKVIPMCPFASAMFSRYPEFDDVRLLHTR